MIESKGGKAVIHYLLTINFACAFAIIEGSFGEQG
jgi:hypothetical protein